MAGYADRGIRITCLVGSLVMACSSTSNQSDGGSGQGGGNGATTLQTVTFTRTPNSKIDILFVLDDWTSTSEIQQKLYDQLPLFLNVLTAPTAPLNLHIAVVTADMGAPGDATACAGQGDDGALQNTPTGSCLGTNLTAGATYLADDGQGNTNFTSPIGDVLQCISLVGGAGCGFAQPLAAMEHALGADNVVGGVPTPPATNAGFLRPDAALAVIFLLNQDDCSAPAGTQIFSLDGGQQNLTNPLGPLQHYRCNQWGHLCKDPTATDPTAHTMPPLKPPLDAQGAASNPTLNLLDCKDNDQGTGLLTPVSRFVDDIRALKPAPDRQIFVAGIVAPPSPYAVAWVPATGGQNTQPGELWPEIMHSCGAAGGDDVNPLAQILTRDGSFGDPAVRVAQFVESFPQSAVISVCQASYAASMMSIATTIGQLPAGPNCLMGNIQRGADSPFNCTVNAQVSDGTTTETVPVPNCGDSSSIGVNGVRPCWMLSPGAGACTGQSLSVMDDPSAPSLSITANCTICHPDASVPGC